MAQVMLLLNVTVKTCEIQLPFNAMFDISLRLTVCSKSLL